jgi:hypothetical protein
MGLVLPGLALGVGPKALEGALTRQGGPFRIKIWDHGSTKGCCAPWVAKLVEGGFPVEFGHTLNPDKLRRELGIPEDLWCCHTALIEGYVIEGHVSVDDIQRLLKHRPFVLGLATPSFYDKDGNVRTEGTYDVVSYARPHVRAIYATHPFTG